MAQEIEGEFGLGDEQVPEVLWEVGGNTGKNGNEVGLEGPDGLLGGIAAMDVRRYKLVSCVVFLCDESLILGAGLVVKDLEVDGVAICLQPGHDCLVGGKAVLVLAGLEGAGVG